jgi:hypothetical protein
MQGADPIPVKRLERVIEEALDARFEVIHCRIDEGHDQHFLIVGKRAAGDDLRGERGEDLRLSRAGHRSNAEAAATIPQDLFLRGSRDKGIHLG